LAPPGVVQRRDDRISDMPPRRSGNPPSVFATGASDARPVDAPESPARTDEPAAPSRPPTRHPGKYALRAMRHRENTAIPGSKSLPPQLYCAILCGVV